MRKNRVLTLSFAALIAGIVSVTASGHSLASTDPTAAAAICIEEGADRDLDEFTKCWVVNMMSDDQRRVAQCIAANKGLGGAAFCMGGMQLSPFGLQVAKCAQRHSGDVRAIAGCVGLPVLPPEGQRLAACVAVNPQNYLGSSALRRRARAHARTRGFRELRRGDRLAATWHGRLHRRPGRDGRAAEVPERDGCPRQVLRRHRRRDANCLRGMAGYGRGVRPEPAAADIWRREVGIPSSRTPWRPVRIPPTTIRESLPAAPTRSRETRIRSRPTGRRCLPRPWRHASRLT